jgi:hypothetical protein
VYHIEEMCPMSKKKKNQQHLENTQAPTPTPPHGTPHQERTPTPDQASTGGPQKEERADEDGWYWMENDGWLMK